MVVELEKRGLRARKEVKILVYYKGVAVGYYEAGLIRRGMRDG
jgi:hypothetical protein